MASLEDIYGKAPEPKVQGKTKKPRKTKIKEDNSVVRSMQDMDVYDAYKEVIDVINNNDATQREIFNAKLKLEIIEKAVKIYKTNLEVTAKSSDMERGDDAFGEITFTEVLPEEDE